MITALSDNRRKRRALQRHYCGYSGDGRLITSAGYSNCCSWIPRLGRPLKLLRIVLRFILKLLSIFEFDDHKHWRRIFQNGKLNHVVSCVRQRFLMFRIGLAWAGWCLRGKLYKENTITSGCETRGSQWMIIGWWHFRREHFNVTILLKPPSNHRIAMSRLLMFIWKLQFAITSSLIAVLLMCQMIVSIKTEIYSEQWKSVELKHRAISGAAMWHRSSLNLWTHNLRLLRRDAHGLWPATSSGFTEITILVKFSLAGRLLSAWPSFLSQYPFTAWYLRTHLHACKWPLKIENKFKQV